MVIEFELVGGPGNGRVIDFCAEYPPEFDMQFWPDCLEPLWAVYRLDLSNAERLVKYRFVGNLRNFGPDEGPGACRCHLIEKW